MAPVGRIPDSILVPEVAIQMVQPNAPLFAESLLDDLLVANALNAGVFAEFLVATALLTVLVMDRVGAGKLRSAALLGGVGGTLFLAAHYVVGPVVVDLTREGIKQVVLFAGAGTAVGLSVTVAMFRPSQDGPTSRGTERQVDDSEIEL